MRCANCQLTCHEKCKEKVQLNCTAFERPDSVSSGSLSSDSSGSAKEDLSTLANISTIVDEEVSEDFDDEGTLKNIDLFSAFCETTDEVTSLVTDDESTLVQSAMEDSLIAPDELQSAIMLYNDGFPSGQETFLDHGKQYKIFKFLKKFTKIKNWQ